MNGLVQVYSNCKSVVGRSPSMHAIVVKIFKVFPLWISITDLCYETRNHNIVLGQHNGKQDRYSQKVIDVAEAVGRR